MRASILEKKFTGKMWWMSSRKKKKLYNVTFTSTLITHALVKAGYPMNVFHCINNPDIF